ncbi:PREDICTED: olfactory receptor 18-like [Chinchilla lanigera]|uniref:olfactory receptor 18-like n=1 Tax=Chinchilla lanigera TaxID=34839 RepID=UPI000697B930|nr:PREDICTED: olfactory receptor 18-like [Chinchilla lanigera]
MALSEDPDLQPVLFGLFLSVYLVTVLGNLLIILIIRSDARLHTPMYFFLSNLSFSDICFISTTVPKMIVAIQSQSTVISYVGCLTQMSVFLIFICMDDMLLTVMAYDRFVAICHPLQYQGIMSPHLCVFLVFVSFMFSLFMSQLHNVFALHFAYFKGVEIANFFCEPTQLLNLACSDTITKNLVMYFVAVFYGFLPLLGIFLSYCKIVSSILRLPSSGGKYKAFSTCGSHLSVVCLFYGSAIGVYLAPAVSHSPRNSAVASLMYTVFTPMLNPFIYSLRNKDIKSALETIGYILMPCGRLFIQKTPFNEDILGKMLKISKYHNSLLIFVNFSKDKVKIYFVKGLTRSMDIMLLTVVAYDQFVTICHPLITHPSQAFAFGTS